MVAGGSISFTLSSEGLEKKLTKQFQLKTEEVIRIGRSPVVNYVIEHRGISQYHAEFRLLPDPGGNGNRLCIRDLSSNGTGLKKAGSETAQGLKKDTDEPVPDGSVLLVPMRLKENHSGRAWLTVAIHDEAQNESPKVCSEGSASGEEDAEAGRKRFVQLLLKTRDITGTTTYEQAKKLLSHEQAWKACDDATRKECFHIFVDHLGDTSTKKKDKKKTKEKDKEKAGKKKDKEKAKEKDRKRPLSGSPDGRRNGKKKAGRRSESRGVRPGRASGSQSPDRRAQRRRRRGRSSGSN